MRPLDPDDRFQRGAHRVQAAQHDHGAEPNPKTSPPLPPTYPPLHNQWDVGGQDKIRRLWRHYYENADALIYVVDSSDPARLQEARLELHKILSDDAVKRTLTSVLVYANKQDMSNAMSPAMMVQELGLNNLHGVDWYCQASAATTGAGLYEGLEWLNGSLTGAPANKRKGVRQHSAWRA